jgi:hypothetical protein
MWGSHGNTENSEVVIVEVTEALSMDFLDSDYIPNSALEM